MYYNRRGAAYFALRPLRLCGYNKIKNKAILQAVPEAAYASLCIIITVYKNHPKRGMV